MPLNLRPLNPHRLERPWGRYQQRPFFVCVARIGVAMNHCDCRMGIHISFLLLGIASLCSCHREVNPEDLLLQQLTHKNVEERRNAALTLQESETLPAALLPALIKALHDPDPRVRIAAAKSLGKAGAAGRANIDELVKLSKEHPDLQVRAALQEAIVRIQSPQ